MVSGVRSKNTWDPSGKTQESRVKSTVVTDKRCDRVHVQGHKTCRLES